MKEVGKQLGHRGSAATANGYASNAKLRMLRAAERSGDVDRWARETQIDPALLRRWQRDRDAGRLVFEPNPGRRGPVDRRPPPPAVPPPAAAELGPELEVRLLRELVRRAMAQGFDPAKELGL